jgi:predicted AAA+ superfamily ATPase
MSQLRAELSRCESRPRLYHLRDQDGRREVDIIVEYGGGRVLGLEVKATSAPKSDDARHLSWLRDELGDRFLGGIVLHTGARPFPLGDRILAAPISSLWS